MRWLTFLALAVAGCSGKSTPTSPDGSQGGGSSTGGAGATGGTDAAAAGTHSAGVAGAVAEGGAENTAELDQFWSTSGSRLKVRTLVSDDGLELPYDIFDSVLELPCSPTRAEDDVLRCLPATELGGVTYSDAACEQPVLPSDQPRQLGGLVAFEDYDCSRYVGPIWRVDAEIPVLERYYVNYSGTCEESTIVVPHVYSVTPLPADSFVAFTPGSEPLGERIAVMLHIGDDGSRLVASQAPNGFTRYYDTKLETPVATLGTRLAPTGSLPTATTEPLASCPPPLRDPPTLPSFDARPACEQPEAIKFVNADSIFRVTPEEATVYSCMCVEGFCAPPIATPMVPVLRALEIMPESAWQVGRSVRPERGGIRSDWMDEVEGFLVWDHQKRTIENDAIAGSRCAIVTAADGELRCLSTHHVSIEYLDADCTVLAQVRQVSAVERPMFWGGLPSNPSDRVQVFELGERIFPAEVFYKQGQTCDRADAANLEVYATGAEVPPETFARFTINTR